MNENGEALRRRIAENLRFAEPLNQRVERIRNLFEAKLRENPLTTWSPTINNFWRREVWGYEGGKFEGDFRVGDLLGRYSLTVYSDFDVDLPNSRLRIYGEIEGYGSLGYELPPMADIKQYDRSGLDAFLNNVKFLESLLKLIGLIPDEEVDSEED